MYIRGRTIHPGLAKGELVNAIKLAAAIIEKLPKDARSPETTEEREGYVHPVVISGDSSEVELRFIVRDFENDLLDEHIEFLRGIAAEHAQTHYADGNCARRRLPVLVPAALALLRIVEPLAAVMHQHVQHDVFRHAFGQIVDRDAHQRHVGQRLVRHQGIDTGAEIEDDAQVGEGGKFPRMRLPHRGIVHLGRIERRVRQLQHAPPFADVVEPVLPPQRRPVFGPAMHQQSERTLVHWHSFFFALFFAVPSSA